MIKMDYEQLIEDSLDAYLFEDLEWIEDEKPLHMLSVLDRLQEGFHQNELTETELDFFQRYYFSHLDDCRGVAKETVLQQLQQQPIFELNQGIFRYICTNSIKRNEAYQISTFSQRQNEWFALSDHQCDDLESIYQFLKTECLVPLFLQSYI